MKIASRAMAALSGAVLATSLCVGPVSASDQGMMAAQQVDRDTYIDYLDVYLFTHVGDNRGPYAAGSDSVP
jgi:3-keto-L-gulonate-6-phosphate decarboxylase